MSFSRNGCLFFIICSILLASCIPIFLWLSVVSVNETLVKSSIEDFFVPSMINKASNSLNTSSSIYFDLKLKDAAYEMGVYYDNLTLTFFYVGNITRIIPIANYTFPAFYQKGGEHGSNTHRSDYVVAHGIPWEEISKKGSSSDVVFRVDLATAVTFKYYSWRSKTHKLAVRGDVAVNSTTGEKVNEKGIRLKSYAPHHSGRGYRGLLVFSVCFYVLMSTICFFSICFTCKR